MIVGIFGKDVAIRKNAALFVKKEGEVSDYVYDYTFSLEEVKRLTGSESLFGDKSIIYFENVMKSVAKGDEDIFFTLCAESKNVCVIDEIDETASTKKLLEKYSERFFDASSLKAKREFPSALCNALKRRDKKGAWVEYVKLMDMDAEPLHGAILWQMKALWSDSLGHKALAYTEADLAAKNKELVLMFHEAHMGKKDLYQEMERWVLSL